MIIKATIMPVVAEDLLPSASMDCNQPPTPIEGKPEINSVRHQILMSVRCRARLRQQQPRRWCVQSDRKVFCQREGLARNELLTEVLGDKNKILRISRLWHKQPKRLRPQWVNDQIKYRHREHYLQYYHRLGHNRTGVLSKVVHWFCCCKCQHADTRAKHH